MKNLIFEAFPTIHDSNLLADMVAAATVQTYPKGAVIKKNNTFFTFFYVILEGSTISILGADDDKSKGIYYIGKGEASFTALLFGLSGKRNDVKIIAEQDTTILSFPIATVKDWTHKYRIWQEYVCENFHQRTQLCLMDKDKSLEQKIDDYLHQKARRLATAHLELTHQNIADDLGTAREVISRNLKKLEKKQKIQLSRNFIQLMNVKNNFLAAA